eukprot:TRINITY_DN4611_c0_g1_i1.p3 TRINITY_DN4611_c0_g1~~TRINITY_DN4611_c0_g1_i1.p3  ORF type:complete len:140 (+),score=53.00 TRINITY_DN4611_c0_g1_i1:253-672(+)
MSASGGEGGRMWTVAAVRPGAKGMNLLVKVIECTVTAECDDPAGGGGEASNVRVAQMLVGDHTGCIYFAAKNGEVDQVKPGCCVKLHNAKTSMYECSMYLTVDDGGYVEEVLSPQHFEVQDEYNVSLLDFEQVKRSMYD